MNKFLMAALLILAVAVPAAIMHAQQPGLALELSVPRVNMVLGEPVVVHVKIVNGGSSSAQVPKDLKPEFGAVQYEISRDGGKFVRFTPWALKEQSDPFAVLPAGANIEDDADIFFDGRKWVFDKPGEYKVRARHRNLQSRELAFKVVAPTNGAEKAAAELLLANPEAGMFLVLRGGDHLTRGMSTLEQVANAAPGSALAAHANLSLGLNKLQAAPNFTNSTVRAADPQAASAYLQRVDTKLLSQEKTAQAMLGQASAYRQLGQERAAREIEEKLPATLTNQFPGVNLNDFQQRTMPNIKQQLQLR
jgi:hypothetical protein